MSDGEQALLNYFVRLVKANRWVQIGHTLLEHFGKAQRPGVAERTLGEIVYRFPTQFRVEGLRLGLRVTGLEIEPHITGYSRAVFNRVHERRSDTSAPQIRSYPEPFHFTNVQCGTRDGPNAHTAGGIGIGAGYEKYALRGLELVEV